MTKQNLRQKNSPRPGGFQAPHAQGSILHNDTILYTYYSFSKNIRVQCVVYALLRVGVFKFPQNFKTTETAQHALKLGENNCFLSLAQAT